MNQGGFDIETLLKMIKDKEDANSPFAASDMIATIGDDSDYARGGYADGGETDPMLDEDVSNALRIAKNPYEGQVLSAPEPMSVGQLLAQNMRRSHETNIREFPTDFSNLAFVQGLKHLPEQTWEAIKYPTMALKGELVKGVDPETGAVTGVTPSGMGPTEAGMIGSGLVSAGALPDIMGGKVASNVLRAGASPEIETALRTARELHPSGLYSHGSEVTAGLPQAKGTSDQMISMLRNAGIKPVELENAGLIDAAGNVHPEWAGRSITREELAQHLQSSMPNIEETTLGGAKQKNAKDNFDLYANELAQKYGLDEISNRALYGSNLGISPEEIIKYENLKSKAISQDPKYEKYTLPGGENYREVLLKLPSKQERDFAFEWFDPATQTSSRNTFATRAEAQSAAPEGAVVAQQQIAERNPDFRSSHWDDPNVLAHLRMSDRVGPNGEKLLHVEEIQSDWGQKGKKSGFIGDPYPDKPTGNWQVMQQHPTHGEIPWTMQTEAEAKDWHKQMSELGHSVSEPRPEMIPGGINEIGVPRAPYVTSTQGWTDLALKRALKEAAEGGYEGIVFTPGAEQAKRYDLSKQISRLVLEENKDGGQLLRAYSPSGDQVISKSITNPEKELPDLVGKEVSEKLLAQNPLNPKRFNEDLKPNDITVVPKENRYQISAPWGWSTHVGKGTVGSEKEAAEYAVNYFNKLAKEANRNLEYQGPVRSLEGQQLSVGGEGMKGYYDKIVPTQLQKLIKGYDKETKLGKLQTNSLPEMLHLPITDKLRQSILSGQKAFAAGGEVEHALRIARQTGGYIPVSHRKHFDEGGDAGDSGDSGGGDTGGGDSGASSDAGNGNGGGDGGGTGGDNGASSDAGNGNADSASSDAASADSASSASSAAADAAAADAAAQSAAESSDIGGLGSAAASSEAGQAAAAQSSENANAAMDAAMDAATQDAAEASDIGGLGSAAATSAAGQAAAAQSAANANAEEADTPSANAVEAGFAPSPASVANSLAGMALGALGPVGMAIGTANSISGMLGGPSLGTSMGLSSQGFGTSNTARDSNTADATGTTGGNAGNGPSAADLGGQSGGFGGSSFGGEGGGAGGNDSGQAKEEAVKEEQKPAASPYVAPVAPQYIPQMINYEDLGAAKSINTQKQNNDLFNQVLMNPIYKPYKSGGQVSKNDAIGNALKIAMVLAHKMDKNPLLEDKIRSILLKL